MEYPKPFRRAGRKSMYFMYTDPVTGQRKTLSTGSDKVGVSKEFIRQFIDRLTPAGTVTFREYARRFFSPETNPRARRYALAGRHYGETHILHLESSIKRFVFPRSFADKPMSDITRGDVLDLMAEIAKENPDRPATTNKVMTFVASIFNEAYFREDIRHNPAMHITKIKYKARERGVFSPEEIRRMFADKDSWLSPLAYDVFLFAALTGRRVGEIIALQWEQIDGNICTIDRAFKRDTRIIGQPKWGISVQFPLCRTLMQRLPEKQGDFVFLQKGKRIFETWVSKHFRAEMDNLGIDHRGRNLTPHSFRHSLNTNLLLAGVPALYVRKYIGWTEGKSTQTAYTHIKAEDLISVADAIDQMFRGS